MRNGDDLLVAAHFAQTLADLLGHLSSETRVDLVKDRNHVGVGGLEGEGEQDPTQLTAARERRQRALGPSGIRREEYLRVGPVHAIHRDEQRCVGEGDTGQLAAPRRR